MAAGSFSWIGIPVSSLKCENRPFKEKRKGQWSFIFEMLCGGFSIEIMTLENVG